MLVHIKNCDSSEYVIVLFTVVTVKIVVFYRYEFYVAENVNRTTVSTYSCLNNATKDERAE